MQSPSAVEASCVVVLATGGTIAGSAASSSDTLGYRAGQIGIAQLVAAVPALAGVPLEAEQLAQIDSKDMDDALWRTLVERVAQHLARPEVAGVVVTHGTDTMEETAYFLQRVLAPTKPVVLTGAMHPATALLADGPQNLSDAVTLVRDPRAPRAVCAVLARRVIAAVDLRKQHARRLDAFSAGDAGDLGVIEAGRFQPYRAVAADGATHAGPGEGPGTRLRRAVLDTPVAAWPRVEIVVSHAGARGDLVDALVATGVRGIVVMGTGNGTLHRELEAALDRAQTAGVWVRRSTRVASGDVIDAADAVDLAGSQLPATGAATAVQARVDLMLELLASAPR